MLNLLPECRLSAICMLCCSHGNVRQKHKDNRRSEARLSALLANDCLHCLRWNDADIGPVVGFLVSATTLERYREDSMAWRIAWLAPRNYSN